MTATVVVGASSELGHALARAYSRSGLPLVVTAREATAARGIADSLGEHAHGFALDVTDRASIDEFADAIGGLGVKIRNLALVAGARGSNFTNRYDQDSARQVFDVRPFGYAQVVASMQGSLDADASILLFGGVAFHRPSPGSLSVAPAVGALIGLVNALAVDMAPVRVNGIHPGPVGDSTSIRGWPEEKRAQATSRTLIGRLVTIDEVVHAARFLLDSTAMNGVNLPVEGGYLLT